MILLALAAAAVTIPLDASARAALPLAEAALTAHGTTQRCTGVWLRDLVAAAGIPHGDAVKGAALTMMVTAVGADGYRVAFSLGEIDAKLGKMPILVADACGGKPLGAGDGPLRLVVAEEARAARSVRQLVGVTAK